ncbi:hypothetical protein Tco_0221394 [Tanacetum coccineum]
MVLAVGGSMVRWWAWCCWGEDEDDDDGVVGLIDKCEVDINKKTENQAKMTKLSMRNGKTKIQADCDLKETNIILQGLPSNIYSLVNHHRVAKDLWERIQLLMQVHQDAYPQPQSVPQIEYIVSTVNQQTHLAKFPQIDSGLAVPVLKQGDDPIDAINKMMSFLSTDITSRFLSTNNQLRNSSNPRQQATIHDGRVTVQPV